MKGDERIRTAVPTPSDDCAYERRTAWLVAIQSVPTAFASLIFQSNIYDHPMSLVVV